MYSIENTNISVNSLLCLLFSSKPPLFPTFNKRKSLLARLPIEKSRVRRMPEGNKGDFPSEFSPVANGRELEIPFFETEGCNFLCSVIRILHSASQSPSINNLSIIIYFDNRLLAPNNAPSITSAR
jgi:hypothetical protein